MIFRKREKLHSLKTTDSVSLSVFIRINGKCNTISKYGEKFCQLHALYVHTYYYNTNLIWRTVSRLMDKVIPLDHPRRFF